MQCPFDDFRYANVELALFPAPGKSELQPAGDLG